MGKARVKGFNAVCLKLINLTISVCILSLVADITRSKGYRPITLLNAAARTCVARTENAGTVVTIPRNSTNIQTANSESNINQSVEWESVRMRVTAYCPCPKCCGEYSDGVTACGHKIQPGDTFVAADRRYDFGTEMLIPGYNNGQPVKVLDRGGAIKGDRLDVFFGSHNEALEWGVRYLDVKVRCE